MKIYKIGIRERFEIYPLLVEYFLNEEHAKEVVVFVKENLDSKVYTVDVNEVELVETRYSLGILKKNIENKIEFIKEEKARRMKEKEDKKKARAEG